MKTSKRLTVAVVTGTRAEFGLLRPVMEAIRKHKKLKLQVIAAGAHFLKPARTIREVEAAFAIAARVPMQTAGKAGRAADALATARGIEGFTRAYTRLKPDWVVVLGDRIEAFAAASAASIAGIAVCHIHGGDRAEGIADEAMRHAITKLSHLHCAATKRSAERIVKMGEMPEHVHNTGSPAIDGLRGIKPMSDRDAANLGNPLAVVLFHPAGLGAEQEQAWATSAIWLAAGLVNATRSLGEKASAKYVLVLAPNNDPGHEIIREQWAHWSGIAEFNLVEHLPRPVFLSLLRRLARMPGGVLVGNSSAGLIEAAALGVRVVNVGPRQAGRERPKGVVDIRTFDEVSRKLMMRTCRLLHQGRWPVPLGQHPYGDGRAAPRIAALLARTNPRALLRKHNTY